MAGISKADQIMLDRIKTGDADAWEEVVSRYHGRLLAFARSKSPKPADAEDLVQDTLISLIQSLDRFRGDASLETYLFTILRRKIIDTYRSKASSICLIQDVMGGTNEEGERSYELPGTDMTASKHVRLNEEKELHYEALTVGLDGLIDGYKKSLNFRDLKIIEMLFYCRLKNKDVAKAMEMPEKQIGLIKHRALKTVIAAVKVHMRESNMQGNVAWLESEGADNLMSDVWENHRISCPKRSTLGKYHLKALDKDWMDYIKFHVETLGCAYCQASLNDIARQSEERESMKFKERIMMSTIGFLKKPGE